MTRNRWVLATGVVGAVAAVGAGAGWLVGSLEYGEALSVGVVAIGAGLALLVGVVAAGVAGLLALLVRSRGVEWASPAAHLGRDDRKAVQASLRRGERPADPALRAVTDEQARRATRVLPLALVFLGLAAAVQALGLFTADEWWNYLFNGYGVVAFGGFLVYGLVQWRRAKRYLATASD